LVALDNSEKNLSCTWITHEFYVKSKDWNTNEGVDPNDTYGGKTNAFPTGPVMSIIIILVPALVLVIFMAVKKRRSSNKDGDDDQPFNIGPEATKVIQERQRIQDQNVLPGMGCSSASRIRGGFVNEEEKNPVDIEGSQMENILDLLGQDTNIDLNDDDLLSYSILGITERATDEEVKKAHRDFARRYHPDRFNRMNDNLRMKAEEEMKRRNRAKEILLDPMKKAMLDKRLRDDPLALIRRKIIP